MKKLNYRYRSCAAAILASIALIVLVHPTIFADPPQTIAFALRQWNVPHLDSIGDWVLPPARPPYPIPELQTSSWVHTNTTTPPSLLLALHFFSSATAAARPKRDLIRAHTPLLFLPRDIQHQVEIKFVVGHSPDLDVERELDEEQAAFGDLLILDGLVGGENMNEGKSIEWIRHIGRAEMPLAKWVLKCDDDTIPFLHHLLPYLASLDDTVPTYFGSSIRRDPRLAPHMSGMLYGFTWNVVETIAMAPLRVETIQREFYEDAAIGELMWNLPSRDNSPAAGGGRRWTFLMPLRDPRTGLVWHDVGTRIYNHHWAFCADASTALAWHNLKSNEQYLAALMEIPEWKAHR